MYARLTTFRVKPDKMDDMLRWRQENEAAIYAQLGLREWIGLWDEEGEVFVVSLFENEQAARDSMPHVWALWEQMAPMLQGKPTAISRRDGRAKLRSAGNGYGLTRLGLSGWG